MPKERSPSVDEEIKAKTQVQPLSVRVVLFILKVWFAIYDVLAYIPFQVFANPQDKLDRSRRVKAKPLEEGNPGSPYRNVDNFKKLKSQLYEGSDTLDKLWDRSTMFYGHNPCFGTREILSVDQEKQPNGRIFEKYNMGKYQWKTYSEVGEIVESVGSGLLAIGHRSRQNIVIFAETRADWMTTALACFKFGFPVVTVYATLGEEQIAHALNEAESSTIVTSQELVPKVVGVMITHANLVAGMTGQTSMIPGLGFGDVYIGYLPLAHVLEVGAELGSLAHGIMIGYSSALTLTDQASKIKRGTRGDAATLKPTVMACVPAIMDRLYKAVMDKVTRASALKQALFYAMYERKREKIEWGYDNPFLNRMVYSHIRSILGGRIRMMLSGGAPLNPETERFMNICFCCPVGQGYGLTETCGAGTIADADDLTTGRVGPPLCCNDIMLDDWPEGNYRTSNKPHPQGEVMISGANVVSGYYKNPEKTAEDFVTINGRKWFGTGDIGEFHPDGSLKIIDRKKDLVKLSHGEYVSLARVETRISTSPLIDNICVYGNSLHPFLVALIVPNKKGLTESAQKIGVKETDFATLCDNSKVKVAVLKDLQELSLKNKLEKFEVPMKIHLCTEVWTPDSGLLTEAYKLKRKPIELHYKNVLHDLYDKGR